MAILGQDGRIQIVREVPGGQTVVPSELRAGGALDVVSTGFWSGDRVTVTADRGLPMVETPLGTAQWGDVGPYERGDTRLHVTGDADQFWQDSDAVVHWEEATPAFVTTADYYINVDQLGRLRFYETMAGALGSACNAAEANVPIRKVDWAEMTIEPYQTEDDPDWFEREWKFSCNLRQWTFETDGTLADSTPIGVRFGESVKALVTGSGSLDFMIDRANGDWTGIDTMRLALLTEKGAKAKAEFFLTTDDGLGSIYYETEILMAACSLSVRIDEALVGSARFATVGTIALKLAPPI